uniref:Nicastrin n=1 Tax=Fundulus heteroclitus TaxID=8078 RepID=A0A3Q2NWT4_FUNHE
MHFQNILVHLQFHFIGNYALKQPSNEPISPVHFIYIAHLTTENVSNVLYIAKKKTIKDSEDHTTTLSSLSGDVGVLHLLESEENLDWVLRTGLHPPYMVIMESALFTRSVMMKLKNGSSRVAGVAVVVPSANPPQGFSPHNKCPNENSGVYSESYGPTLAHCNTTVWNPLGNGLSYEEFDFPIFSLKDDNDTQLIKQCYVDHNRPVNGSDPQYPLCAMQLFSHMSAVTNTATCMRRNTNGFTFSPESICEPLGDHNIWAPAKPLNTTQKGHKAGESMVMATLDSRSFFSEIGPGAESAASGLITLLAAAHALRNATQEAQLSRTIFYTFFHGETFDYIGSSRMVYDMEKNQFPIDLDNVHSVLEIGQVGLFSSSKVWLHTDPVSRRNGSVEEEVKKLVSNLQTAAKGLNVSVEEPGVTQPLPPSSLQRFLRARPFPGVVIQDYSSSFANMYYQSMFDNADSLKMSYPPNLTPEEQLNYVTDTAKVRAYMMLRLLVNTANFYISVERQTSLPTVLVQHLLANLTGSTANVTQEDCKNQRENQDDKESKHVSYSWVQGAAPPNSTERKGFCVRSTVHGTKALSPAFELEDYNSKDYSTWTESNWKQIKGRIFLVASHDLEVNQSAKATHSRVLLNGPRCQGLYRLLT